MYEDRLRRIEEHGPYPRVWLDVGCGGGGMLECASNAGFQVEGIEPGPSARIARSRLGHSVYETDLKGARTRFLFDGYGVVSYFHVLEHVYDPLAELQLARGILAQNGLLVLEVPYFDSISWRLLGSRHRHFYRGHRSYFNSRSLARLLHRAGYSIEVCEVVPYWVSVDWLLMRVGGAFDRFRRFLPEAIGNRLLRIDLRDVLMAIAKKSES